MKLIHSLLISILLLSLSLFPIPLFAKDLNPPLFIDELSTTFSDKFCLAISNGIQPKDAGESTAKEMIRGLIFSPNLKEIIAFPKENLVSSLSTKIFDTCGEEINISENDLYDYLLKFANRDRQESSPKPFKPFDLG